MNLHPNPTLYDGAEQLAPGLYLRPDRCLVFRVSEMLRDMGMPDTRENRDMCGLAVESLLVACGLAGTRYDVEGKVHLSPGVRQDQKGGAA